MLSLVAFGSTAYMWSAAPFDIYRGPLNGTGEIAVANDTDLLFSGVYGPYTLGQTFANHHDFEVLGFSVGVASDAVTGCRVLAISLPYAMLLMLLAIPLTWWSVIVRRVVRDRTNGIAAGFEVVPGAAPNQSVAPDQRAS